MPIASASLTRFVGLLGDAAVITPGGIARASPSKGVAPQRCWKRSVRHRGRPRALWSPRMQALVGAEIHVPEHGRQADERGADPLRVGQRFRVMTTESRHMYKPAENLLNREFSAQGPDKKWLCDITYVPTGEGTIYLASVLDVVSRKIVGWSMASHGSSRELCLDAMKMALIRAESWGGTAAPQRSGRPVRLRRVPGAVGEHGDHRGMSRKGNCYDNAMMERAATGR